MRRRRRAGRHRDDPDVEAVSVEGRHRRTAGHGVPGGPARASIGKRRARLRALLTARLLPVGAAPPAVRRQSHERLDGDDHLLQRQHRRAEGRGAHARERPGQRGQPRSDLPDGIVATASSACCRSSIRSASPARCGFRCCRARSVVYHPNPMDAKTVGELAGEYKATMLISTPTFCNSYLRRCTPEQFAHLKYAIVGAEKLREPLATAFEAAVRRRAARRLRLHGDGAGRGREPPERRRRHASGRSARSSDRSAIRFPASRRRSSIRKPARARSSAGRACCS